MKFESQLRNRICQKLPRLLLWADMFMSTCLTWSWPFSEVNCLMVSCSKKEQRSPLNWIELQKVWPSNINVLYLIPVPEWGNNSNPLAWIFSSGQLIPNKFKTSWPNLLTFFKFGLSEECSGSLSIWSTSSIKRDFNAWFSASNLAALELELIKSSRSVARESADSS